MAFTTQQGTGGAPWTFLGTPEPDTIAVITGSTQDAVAFDFIAEGFEGNDVINWNGTRSVTIKGGQGDDNITNNVAASSGLTAIITNSFINGNDGKDIIGNSQIGLLATLSTVSGGQGDDKLYIGSLQSSKVNGNRGADFLEVGDLDSDENIVENISNFNAASIFGGQGDDRIEIVSQFRQITNSEIAGQDGNDLIAAQIGSFDVDAAAAAGQSAFQSFQTSSSASFTLVRNPLFQFDCETGIEEDPSFSGSVLSGGLGNDIIDASGLLLFDEIDEASGSKLNIVGNEGNDSIFGGANDDIIAGDDGDDWLAGYGCRDTIQGGNGDDLLIGAYYDAQLSFGFVGDGAGDTLSGGTGSNRFFVPGSASNVFTLTGVNPLGSTFFVDLIDADNDTNVSNGDTLGVQLGADVITDWNSGNGSNLLDTTLGATLARVAADPAKMSLGASYDGSVDNFAVRGFYTERNNELGQFVVNEFGTDIAVWTNYTGTQTFTGIPPVAVGTFTLPDGTIGFNTLLDNLTVLKDVPTTVVLTENQFVAI